MMNSNSDEQLFRCAIEARDAGNLLLAISYLDELVKQPQELQQEPGIYLNIRANIQKDVGDVDAALRDFEASIKLLPKSRLASSTYFHFLLDLGHFFQAQEEGVRYLNVISHSQLSESVQVYRDTIEGILGASESEFREARDIDGFIDKLRSKVESSRLKGAGPSAASGKSVPTPKALN